MWSRRRLTLWAAAAAGTITLVLAFLAVPPSGEPRYKGLTLSAWQSMNLDPQRGEAIIIIGTNNLQWLVHRINYNAAKDPVCSLYFHLPALLRRNSLLYKWATRRGEMVAVAAETLICLGPMASPVVPQLNKIAHAQDQVLAIRALNLLMYIGEQGRPAIMSFTDHTNPVLRAQAFYLLFPYTNLLSVRQALTNALHDPDPQVRTNAVDVLAGRIIR